MDQMINSNDYELLYMIYQMDEYSLQILVKKYQKLLKIAVRYYFRVYNLDVATEELFYDTMTLLYDAIYAYRMDRQANFSTFFHSILHNKLTNYYRYLHTYEGACLRKMVSLDYIVGDSNIPFVEKVANRDLSLEGIYYLYQENANRIFERLSLGLKPMEMHILRLRLDGGSYREIANMLNIDEKKVDYVLSKVRKNKGFIDYDDTL